LQAAVIIDALTEGGCLACTTSVARSVEVQFAGYIHAILRPSQASGAAELLSMGEMNRMKKGVLIIAVKVSKAGGSHQP